jgi:exopolysaccharide biosynthesis polyprenyl glycosylphosphotransferase
MAGAATTAPTSPHPVLGIVAPAWRRRLPLVVAGADLVAGVAAMLLALRLRFGGDLPDLYIAGATVRYLPVAVLLGLAWPGVLAALGAYRSVVVGNGADEMSRVVEAGLTLFAALAVMHLLLETSLSGRLVAIGVGLLVLLTLVVRFVASRVVLEARLDDRWRHRAVVYGAGAEVTALARQFSRPALGVDVVGTCLTDLDAAPRGVVSANVPVVDGAADGDGGVDDRVGEAVLDVMASSRADMLTIAGGTSPAEVRALAWALEGTGAELMIAPAVPDLAQQRVVVEPVGGVVLLRVEECRQQRGRLLVKRAIDTVLSILLLVLLAPVFAAVAVAVKRSGPGPVLFRQERVGQHGRTFRFLKFRTMVAGADDQRDGLAAANESDGLLFKVREDPRITPTGRYLRRMSLDELPQLWNVLRGDMSLVGPRPLPVDAEEFEGDARRRLRVRPGITGLWQVSGRSDLAWEETVALDMHYVDHWSLGLDLAIIARTPMTVLRGSGAY